MILGMDPIVFTAWILTIFAAIGCVVYGIYHEYIKKTEEKKPSEKKEDD